MSVDTTTSSVRYTGNGATSVYPYTFRILEDADLLVTQIDTDDVEATLVLNTDYTVDGAGEASGSITLLDGNLTSGYVLKIRRVRELKQNTSIRNQGSYFPEIHEDVFDHLVMIDQQQQNGIDRSIKAAETDDEDLDMTLPPASERASSYSGFNSDGEPVALSAPTDTSVTTTYSRTILDDSTASEAQTTLGLSTYFKTLLAAATAAATRTLLGFSGSGGTVSKSEMDLTTTTSSVEISNLGITATVAANALTVSITQADNSTPSSTGPVTIGTRSASATAGTYNRRQVTSALSVVVSSGSTLGHTSAVESFIYVYVIDNGGVLEAAVSSALVDEGTLQTTTAEGGAGAADSATVLYSTAARTDAAVRLVGRLRSTQATAGTWASAISEISMAPFNKSHYLESLVTSETPMSASATIQDATTLSIPPGEWDISFVVNLISNSAVGITVAQAFIGTAAGTSTTGLVNGANAATLNFPTGLASGAEWTISIPSYRVKPTTTTTYRLKLLVTYPGTAAGFRCRLSARRVA